MPEYPNLENGEESVHRLRDTGSTVAVQEALLLYVTQHIPPGGFLRALLSNDLRKTFERADHVNSKAVGELVAWLYNEANSQCWGSPEKVEKWLAERGSGA